MISNAVSKTLEAAHTMAARIRQALRQRISSCPFQSFTLCCCAGIGETSFNWRARPTSWSQTIRHRQQ